MRMHGQVGDEIVLDSVDIGQPTRHGSILEVRADANQEHYRVRWENGHESLFYPGSTARIVHQTDPSR
jgi:Domain of unknown function (DUF1918)